MHPKIRQVYDQGPAIKSCFFFAVFTFKVEVWIVLKLKRREYYETKQNGSTLITRYGFGFVALRETSFRRHFFFSVLDTRLDQILPTLILCPSKSFKPCTEELNGRDILTAPWYVSVSTKYVIVHFDDCHCGSPPITVAVECRCRPAVCLSVPTLHKPAPLWTKEDWL